MAPFLAIFFFLLVHATTVLGMDDLSDLVDEEKIVIDLGVYSTSSDDEYSKPDIQIITTKVEVADDGKNTNAQIYRDQKLHEIQQKLNKLDDEEAEKKVGFNPALKNPEGKLDDEELKKYWQDWLKASEEIKKIPTNLIPESNNAQDTSITHLANQQDSISINNNNNVSGVDNSSDSDEPLPKKKPTPSRSKKYIFIPIVLLVCFGAYKYIPWKNIVLPQRMRDILSIITPFFYKTQYGEVRKIIIQDSSDAPVSVPDQKEEKDSEPNETINTHGIVSKEPEEQIVLVDDLPIQSSQSTLGKTKYPFGSMKLLGPSVSATFLLAFAAYLITTDAKTKRIEKTRYDVYRTYFRYAVAALAGTISVVLFLKTSQSI